ncbi:MAG TPA: type II toxin-antitoxin system death-on-curing family toxin [Halococcus sp.]|nr:type II toxin-antitoxin system death-on-curing family toxin [Halococcus sp.]
MTDDLPMPDEILAAHDRIEVLYDLKYKGTMKAAPKRTLRREVLEPAAEYDDLFHRAATLLWKIESAHIFEDANKRTAWTVTRAYLRRHGIEPPADHDLSERVVRRAGKFDVDELAEWLETGEIDESRLPEIEDGETSTTIMNKQEREHEADEGREWAELVDEIIEEDREILDRLA